MADRIDLVLDALRCPVCGDGLDRDDRRLHCHHDHSFDLAQQGYVNLAVGSHAGTGDDGAMVAARDRFLGGGHFRTIAGAVVDRLRPHVEHPSLVLDLAGGTGYYAATVLDEHRDAHGLLVDLSTPALRRAARAHDRLAAAGADAWTALPVNDGAADVVLSVFGPRNRDEIARVLAPTGCLVTVTPHTEHLHEIVTPLGMLAVGSEKSERLAQDYGEPIDQEDVRYELELSADALYDLVAMGPTARHVDVDELRRRIAALPDPTTVTVAVTVQVHRP